ncbi:AAA family ATPase, partial [Mycobacteroides abscessus]
MTQATTSGSSGETARNALAALREQIATVVVGQDSVVSGLV